MSGEPAEEPMTLVAGRSGKPRYIFRTDKLENVTNRCPNRDGRAEGYTFPTAKGRRVHKELKSKRQGERERHPTTDGGGSAITARALV